ncbi:MAG: hypothetical protein LRY53_11575 [Burkholderiaceae bacterium]|nr:hypothetical protein [Burkholderiaceae bacterium]MCD8515991.1 hypothetical protein [Burkholderiaceae bacterium]MCD8566230.1 hypothetical protein [Burkholderiaceae bacterium]
MKNKIDSISAQRLQTIAADLLASYGMPAISRYEFAVRLFKHLQVASPEFELNKTKFDQLCGELMELRLLNLVDPASRSGGYILFGGQKASVGELLCCLDPFAYVSQLSALEFHGLTDRFPRMLYITRPDLPNWRSFARQKMRHDLGESQDSFVRAGLPQLRLPDLAKIGDTVLHVEHQTHLGAFRLVSGSALRVSTLGRAFLEMLRDPDLCGGIQHVIDIYRQEANRYLRLIVEDIDRHGRAIDKVRAGFLLTQVCGLEHPVISRWESFAKRGGSRKLDPDEGYAPEFSERWMLSINVPSLLQVVEVEAVDRKLKSRGVG